ncbi:hypothetical protein Tco_0747088 [Tanacetum coccineum]
MKMVPYEAFACRCGARDVVLRESYKPKTRVRLLVSSPRASTPPSYSPGPSTPPIYSPGPSTPPSYSPGPSRNAECSNCKLLLGKIKLRKKEIMSWLRRCAELREAAQSDEWVEMLVLYCWRSAEEDFRVAGVKLCEEVAAANEETSYFIQELDVVPGLVVVTQKTSEFLKETQEKDDEWLRQLKALARDTEARAREKCIFIEKLKGNQPF